MLKLVLLFLTVSGKIIGCRITVILSVAFVHELYIWLIAVTVF